MKISSIATILCLLSTQAVNGYVTSGLPQQKHIEWLKKMTGDICDSPPGKLTHEMIESAPQIMRGWTLSKRTGTENALAVESLMKRLIEESIAGNAEAIPTTSDYNYMLESWAKSNGGVFAAERCEQIVTEMQQRFHAGDLNVKPSLSSFKAVLMAWRQSGESFSPVRAQRVLDWMIRLYSEGENDLAKPDSDCFDIVMQSWARSKLPNAPRENEKLLAEMKRLSQVVEDQRLKPRTTSFNAVLSAWAKSKQPGAAQRAYDVFGFMQRLYLTEGNNRVAPDAVSYSSVISALSRSGDIEMAQKADDLMKLVEISYRNEELQWEPDTILFNSAIGCWAKVNKSGAYRRARSLLDRQLNLYNKDGCENCKPDVFSFSSVLSACAWESGDKQEKAKAFNVAAATYKELCANTDEYGLPNHVTYGTMMKACVLLLPHGSTRRRKWIKTIFEESKKNGQVGEMVVGRMREGLSHAEFYSIMEGHSKKNLPPAWTKNVDERDPQRRNRSQGQKKKRRHGKRAEV